MPFHLRFFWGHLFDRGKEGIFHEQFRHSPFTNSVLLFGVAGANNDAGQFAEPLLLLGHNSLSPNYDRRFVDSHILSIQNIFTPTFLGNFAQPRLKGQLAIFTNDNLNFLAIASPNIFSNQSHFFDVLSPNIASPNIHSYVRDSIFVNSFLTFIF
jgi:hypothetical protein